MDHYDWLNQNSHRKYPFQSQCTLQTIGKTFTLPNSLFVDCFLQMSYQFQQQFYLNYLEYSPEKLYVEISQAENSTLALQGTKSENIISLVGTGVYEKSIGKMIIGTLSELPYGSYSFYPSTTLIEPCRILKLCSGISSINGISDGNINLLSKTNVKITKEGNNIIIDTQDGICACNNNPCIKSINGITVDNFIIEGVGCVKVNNNTNGISIENTCESSCCGSDQVNDILDQLNDLKARVILLENRITN